VNSTLNASIRRVLVAIVALAAWCAPHAAFAQGGGNTPDPRPFALFRDMFDTAGEWHGPWVNMAYQPQFNWVYQSEGTPMNNLNSQVSWGSYIWITPEITVNVNMQLGQVGAPKDNDDWLMYGEGITAGDIWIQWSDQRTGIIAGRFTAPFGIAPLILPGIFDTNLVNSYNFGGLLGGLATLSTGDEGYGIHALNAAVFGVDTTFMSRGIFAQPSAPSGPGTGGGADSWMIGYSGDNIPVLFPTLQVNVSYIQFGDGSGAPANQKGFNAGGYWQWIVNGDENQTLDAQYWTIGPMFEYVHFWNNDGIDGASSDYYTVGLISNYGNWQTDVVYTQQNLSQPGQSDQNNYLISANLGYNFFGPQSLIQMGYGYQVTDGKENQQVGLQVNFPIVALEYFPLWN